MVGRLTGDVADGSRDNAKVGLLEPDGSALTKDEVGSTSDHALGVQLVSLVGEEGVLESGEGNTAANN